MENCYKCRLYNDSYNKMMQSGNDTLPADTQFCIEQHPTIPRDIMNDEVICPFFEPKEE